MTSSGFERFTRKAWRRLKNAVKDADVIVEVLDPRDPPAFRLREFEDEMVKMGKSVILVINKSDLVPRGIVERWKKILSKDFPTIYISARKRLGTGELRRLILRSAKGKKKIINVAVVGYPNVGKSTIINILKGAHSAPTGAKPGLTRHVQIIRRGRLRILDTPGVFPIEDEINLIYKGAIRIDKLDDPIHYCEKLLKYILEIDEDSIKKTYGIEEKEPIKIIESLALLRRKLKKGGVLDIETAARIILKDWQDGKIVAWRKPERYQ